MDTGKLDETSAWNRRRFLATTAKGLAATGAMSLFRPSWAAAASGDAVRPFRARVPNDQLADLRRRLRARLASAGVWL